MLQARRRPQVLEVFAEQHRFAVLELQLEQVLELQLEQVLVQALVQQQVLP